MSKPPVRLADFPEGWAAERRVIIVRDGYALQPYWLTGIHIKSLTDNKWYLLTLPNDATEFAEPHERDHVLAQLQGEKPI